MVVIRVKPGGIYSPVPVGLTHTDLRLELTAFGVQVTVHRDKFL